MNLPLVHCICGEIFAASAKTDYVLMVIGANKPCPRCGGSNFRKLSYPKEYDHITDRDTGEFPDSLVGW